jgi:hypothetical protein
MKGFDITYFLKSKGVIKARVWEKGSHQRIYLTVKGVSQYQHNKGNMYLEHVNDPLLGTFWFIGNESIPFKSEDLDGLTFLDFKFALI